jgi:cytochrome c biogenesis protein CcmG/thiol:disulfide interchange protein DsbE
MSSEERMQRAPARTVNKGILVGGLLVVLPLLFLFARSFGNDPHAVRSPLVGRQAPPFSLRTYDEGRAISLARLRGTPVVVNFWATWCEPCKAEHGVLTRAAQKYEGKVQFLGIVYEDEVPRIDAFLDRYGSGYPALMDVGGKTAIAYGVSGIPETFFIGADGTVVSKFTGPIHAEELEARIAEILVEAP